ncbi:hypothetical protein [Streptomyces sp. SID13031]|uniref:hypothetical protein n=1 Tax=Streptomyces sp. SID13031 TaxID=2706046 RepID=UPI0013C87786|nr:hypothetical protein [Streptomyces sp. SID13031]NEA35442.1 hypothetical protein [Streptomyces sp. SID13031]
MTSLNRRQFNRALLAVPAAALVGTGLDALAPAAASAAPADWNAHLLAGQANGHLMHQTRAGDGTWKPSWEEVGIPAVSVYRVSCVGMSNDLHVVAALNSGAPSHGVRNRSDGSWTAFSPIPSQSGPTPGAPHVAVTSLGSSAGSKLHVFGASERGNALYYTGRNADGSWHPRWVNLRTFGSIINHVATTRVGTTIDTAVVTDGKLFHAIRASDGTWSNWGNIESVAGEIANDVLHVALAGIGSQLHVVALSGSSDVYHAIRRADGSWQRFKKVTAFSNYSPFFVSAANVGAELQVAIIDFTANASQIIRHNIRRSDGSWTPVKTVRATGLTNDPGVLALTGTL